MWYAANFIYSYLKYWKQNVKIHDAFGFFETLLLAVPKSSVLGPILFYIFLNDLLAVLKKSQLYNLADHDTISVEIKSADDPLKILKEESEPAIKLFRVSNMFVNLDKFQPTVLHKGNKNHNSNITLNIENIIYNKHVKISKTILNNNR